MLSQRYPTFFPLWNIDINFDFKCSMHLKKHWQSFQRAGRPQYQYQQALQQFSWMSCLYRLRKSHQLEHYPAYQHVIHQDSCDHGKLPDTTRVFVHFLHLEESQKSLRHSLGTEKFENGTSWNLNTMHWGGDWTPLQKLLGGGFKHFSCSPLPGEMIQFD